MTSCHRNSSKSFTFVFTSEVSISTSDIQRRSLLEGQKRETFSRRPQTLKDKIRRRNLGFNLNRGGMELVLIVLFLFCCCCCCCCFLHFINCRLRLRFCFCSSSSHELNFEKLGLKLIGRKRFNGLFSFLKKKTFLSLELSF